MSAWALSSALFLSSRAFAKVAVGLLSVGLWFASAVAADDDRSANANKRTRLGARRTDNTPQHQRCAASHSACARALARGAHAPAGARVERGSGARGATDRTREEPRRRIAPQRATPLLDCGGD